MNAPSKWDGMPMTGFDIESTGISVWDDRVVTAALVDIREGTRPNAGEWLINPGVPIPAEATAVHGITTEKAERHGNPPAEILDLVTSCLANSLRVGIPVVGMNLPYDLTLLEQECLRHDVQPLTDRLGGPSRVAPIIDIGVLDKKGDPYRVRNHKDANKNPILDADGNKSSYCHGCRCGAVDRTLTGLCRHYGIVHTGAHNATADVIASCRLVPRILTRYPNVFRPESLTLTSLHQAQIGWRREQMDGLRAYFDRNGIEHDGCSGDWPIIRPTTPAAPTTDTHEGLF